MLYFLQLCTCACTHTHTQLHVHDDVCLCIFVFVCVRDHVESCLYVQLRAMCVTWFTGLLSLKEISPKSSVQNVNCRDVDKNVFTNAEEQFRMREGAV